MKESFAFSYFYESVTSHPPQSFSLFALHRMGDAHLCGSLAVIEGLEHRSIPVQHVLILVLLGLMALKLPSGHAWVKVLYTAIAPKG
ncbi:hypothetical protein [Nostoc sphaeroides]|uniref:hypothetical protein n=1 Tax=Nostoc sphaeroides TaxID=446679 RepID=UPI000E544BEF|nr:hypothetical protein [Nostoc sphaeroides]